MKLNELVKKIAALEDVKTIGDSRTFTYKVPFDEDNTHFFVRPLADDLVLASSVMHGSDAQSVEFGLRILDTAEPHVPETKGMLVAKIPKVNWGLANFDSLLMVGPQVEKFRMTSDDHFLTSRTVVAYAVNHIEYSGDETEAEAGVRGRHVILSDIARAITPVIFLRYHKQTGQRSAEYLAIAKHEYATRLINELPRDGGTVELENYERVRLSFVMKNGAKQVDTNFDGKTQKLSLSASLRLMDTLTMKGAEAAKKDW